MTPEIEAGENTGGVASTLFVAVREKEKRMSEGLDNSYSGIRVRAEQWMSTL